MSGDGGAVAAANDTVHGARPPRARFSLAGWRAEAGVGSALIVLIAFCGLLSPNFLTVANFRSILTQNSVTCIVAVGMTLVLITGEIDLSVGSTVGLAGTAFAFIVVDAHQPVILGAIAVLAGAALIGGVTGVLRVVWGIPSFITTIGLLSTLRGLASLISGGVSIAPLPPGLDVLWYGRVGSVTAPMLIAAIVLLGGGYLLWQTRTGRHLYAVGGDAVTALRYGVRVRRLRIIVFVVVQLLAAFGGIMLAARLDAGSASSGEQLELDVIAAVIVGGTSLAGGSGRITGTLIGVLFVAVLRNGMVLLGINPIGFMIAQGLVIILAVWWSMLRRGGRAAVRP